MLKEPSTYEIMRPADVGVPRSTMVLGKHSGRHAFKEKVRSLGYQLDGKELDGAFSRFKTLSDKKKAVFDEDIAALLDEQIASAPELFVLDYLNVTSGTQTVPTATVRLTSAGKVHQDASTGDGPVDAACKAIDRITGIKGELVEYGLRAVTGGKDALGEVTVQVRSGKRLVPGRASSTDIIEASVKAYLSAVNRLAFRASAASKAKAGKRLKSS